MSDHVPLDIQLEIMKRLPVKSLLQFKLVSKLWKSLIHNPNFITDYNTLTQIHPHHHRLLFIRYDDLNQRIEPNYGSIVDDDHDKLAHHKFDQTAVPLIIENLYSPKLLGCSQGLLCFYGYHQRPVDLCMMETAVIWNPSIRKSVTIDVANHLDETRHNKIVVGFGVCPVTSDPKLVKIKLPINHPLETYTSQVEVFSLSSSIWRSHSCNTMNNVHCKLLTFSSLHECVDRFIYWCPFTNDAFKLIISFDLTNEEFGEVSIPDSLAHSKFLDMSKLRESLVLLPDNCNSAKSVYDVWMMEGGATKLFKKLFTINSPYYCMTTLAFRNNGDPIMETRDYDKKDIFALEVYKPSSKQFKDIGIYGSSYSFFVISFVETLLLLDY